MTHGRITFEGGGQVVHAYAYHTGHTVPALRSLLNLPRLLVEEEMRGGPGHHRLRLAQGGSCTMLEMDAVALANWFCGLEFNHWQVVPDLSYVPYPRRVPDLLVTVSDHSYTVAYSDEGDDPEMIADAWGELEPKLRSLNDGLPENCRVKWAPLAKGATCFPAFEVPFEDAYKHLMEQAAGRQICWL